MRPPRFALSKVFKVLCSLCFLAVSTLPALAHELWLEPDAFQITPQTRLVVNIVNGQKFRGHALPYLPNAAARFDLVAGGAETALMPRAGDRPALDMVAGDSGLHVVVYQAAHAALTYHEWEKFQNFITHKDLPASLAEHLDRGLPETGFKEIYSRYSKVLLAVGDAAGADQAVGLATEIVALANPYTDDLSAGLPVRLLYNQAPRSDAQIEVFERASGGDVAQFTLRTNGEGRALVPVRPGHSYMLDAVVLRLPDAALAAEFGADYESLWANLTFAVPAKD